MNSPNTSPELITTRPIYQGKKLFKNLVILIVFIVLLGSGFFFLARRQEPQSETRMTEEKVTTESAKTTSDKCPGKQEYVNEKQGYRVCFPSNWQHRELAVSGLKVGFDPQNVTQAFPGVLSVSIHDKSTELSLQETINNSLKYEYSKAFVSKAAGTKIIYTRGRNDPLTSHRLAIDTVVTTLGRTYTIRLNTNEDTLSNDEKIYEEFLASWEFIQETPLPPWSNSRNILVYSPWINDKVKNPIRLSGEAIAFETIVNVRIKDKAEHILLETTIHSESGVKRSPFAADLSFSRPSTKEGVLEVFTISVQDGSEQDKVAIPITFTD